MSIFDVITQFICYVPIYLITTRWMMAPPLLLPSKYVQPTDTLLGGLGFTHSQSHPSLQCSIKIVQRYQTTTTQRGKEGSTSKGQGIGDFYF